MCSPQRQVAQGMSTGRVPGWHFSVPMRSAGTDQSATNREVPIDTKGEKTQWLSNLNVHQKHMKGGFKYTFLGPHPQSF